MQIASRIRRCIFDKGDEYRIYVIDEVGNGRHTSTAMRVKEYALIPNGAKFTAEGTLVPFQAAFTFELTRFIELTTSRGKSLIAVIPQPKDVSAEGLIRWIARGNIPGVSKGTADRLRERVGDKLPDIISDSSTLAKLGGIPESKAQAIASAWAVQQNAPTHATLLDLEVPPSLARKLIESYGAGAIEHVKQNPWRLAQEFGRISLDQCDRIAGKLAMPEDHPERIHAGLIRVLREAGAAGHCGLPLEVAVSKTAKLLSLQPHAIETLVGDYAKIAPLVVNKDTSHSNVFIQHRNIARAEETVATFVRERMQFALKPLARITKNVDTAAQTLGFSLDPSQRDAAITALASPLTIITGGPGTGKTTVQKIIAAAITVDHRDAKILYMAPTGRAAKRLSEVTGHTATTIHRALEISPETGQFIHNADDPITADHIIIDEVSMVDMQLAAALFSAIKPGTSVTLVGDADQLPSVGAGNLLADLIESRRIAMTRLNTIHRQGRDSGIIAAAHRINYGEYPVTKDFDDIHIETIDSSEAIVKRVTDLVTKLLPMDGFDPVSDIQVLTPTKKGPTGTIDLNETLKAAINPGTADTSITLDQRKFSIGDKIMQIRNDYEKNVFNGEIGSVTAVSHTEKTIKVSFGDLSADYTADDTQDLLHAYASTIHKAQGSEFPVVILVLDQDQWMATRRLVYTAVTRAKTKLIVLTQQTTLRRAIYKTRDAKRYSSLCDRLGRPLALRTA